MTTFIMISWYFLTSHGPHPLYCIGFINTCIKQECIKLIKMVSKDFYIVKNPEKNVSFHKNVKHHNC